MTTERPRIQAYLEEELHEHFKEWKQELGIKKDSEALNVLLAEYFGVSQSPIPNPQSPTADELRILIQEELWDSGKQDFIEGIKLEAQAMIAQQIAESKSFWEATGDSFRETLERQQVQIQALEKRIEALEPEAMLLRKLLTESIELTQASVNELPSEPLAESLPDNIEQTALENDESIFSQESQAVAEDLPKYSESPSGSLAQSEAPGLEEADSPNADAGEKWKIGDRVRVLCKSNYEKMTGTIVDYLEALGWGVHVDRWWTVSGISESVIDERQKKGSSIWCDADEMELLIESPSESLTQFEATRSPGQLPLNEAPGLEEADSSNAYLEGDTDELIEGDSLMPDELLSNSPRLSAAPSLPEFLNAANLARRLRISKSVISRHKSEATFEEWSRQHDPAGIGWRFPGKGQRFFPVT